MNKVNIYAFKEWLATLYFIEGVIAVNYKNLKEKLEPQVKKVVEGLGTELVDIDFIRHKGEMTVTVYIYKKDGLDIDLLTKASEELNPIFDATDELKEKYFLEVSTPGLDRPIKTDDDFRRNLKIKLEAVLKNKEKITGILKEYDDETFTLEGEETKTIKRSDVKKLTQAIEF